METTAPSDPELLADWLGRQRESAFHALVARYAGLVHATAKRTCGDDSMAAEASQLTFIALARKAHSLTSCASLGGWLHTTAMMQAKNLSRKSQRENRKRQLLQAAMENESHSHPSDSWKDMQPVLDAALASLPNKEREALLLRFYRSLSIRETAETLGIATDAAQKRIDRAIERLRGKLTRRGCQVGGSLSAAMLAGFAADAQAAALPVSVIASKAIAAGTVSTFSLSAIITTATALMKSSSLIPPVLVLLIAGSWIGSQRYSLSAMEKESVMLRRQIAEARASSNAAAGATQKPATRGKAATGKAATDKEAIDWKKLAAQIAKAQQGGRIGDMLAITRLQQRMQSMTKEEMVAAFNEIMALDIPPEVSGLLQAMISDPFVKKDPEFLLTLFIDRLDDDRAQMGVLLSRALKNWTQKDPAQAQAWFDQQIAAGKFDSKALDGTNKIRLLFEGQLIGALMGSDTGAAARRLEAMPEDQRADVIRYASMVPIKDDQQLAYADLIRKQLPAKQQAEKIADIGSGLVSRGGFTAVDAYLDRIAATPEERTVTVTNAAMSKIQMESRSNSVTRKSLDAMREWVDQRIPGSADSITGKALGSATRENQGMTFAAAAALAQQYDASSGKQDVLAAFLGSTAVGSHRAEVRELALKITDPTRREEILKHIR